MASHLKHNNTMNEKVDGVGVGHQQLASDQTTIHIEEDDSREYASRLTDDLELLRAERLVSNREDEGHSRGSRDHQRRRAPAGVPEDAFNEMPSDDEKLQQQQQQQQQQSETAANKAWIKVKKFPRAVRYLVYWIPVAAILLVPILVDEFVPGGDVPVGGPGGVELRWFGIWLQIIWGSLWASRFLCASMPYLFKWCARAVGSTNHKKWFDVGKGLELPTALFLWMLAMLCSSLPTLNNHRDRDSGDWGEDGNFKLPFMLWIDVVFKVIIALFVLAALNVIEKVLIQWIASSFHMRTYAYRIEANKRDVQYLVALYTHCRTRTADEDLWNPYAAAAAASEEAANGGGDSSTTGPAGGDSAGAGTGSRTPIQKTLQQNARQAWSRVGNVANRVAGDFTGRKILHENHPQKVVAELLRTTPTSRTLARMIFRTLVASPDDETLTPDDFAKAFESAEDAEACLGVFDRDLNGDVSMEEMELVCNEVHLEKKAIAASLKDLDSVIRKLDRVFVFVVLVIAVIVFISIISGSAAAALGSAGTTVLGLAWMLQATAQEFLQSVIFVFVKHPFDVGDRVRVYGNTGDLMVGDDYYVQEISLLYTEFRKMQGHVVQAPNSLLNNLFILNQRRSNGLADPIELKVRFGTTNEAIEELRDRMLAFVCEHKRDYAPRVITEVCTIDEVYSVTLNIVFFHKSNFQNELLRLQRHNRFAGELMRQMALLGIEGPRKQQPGGTRELPFYWSSVNPPAYQPSTLYAGPNGPQQYANPQNQQQHPQQQHGEEEDKYHGGQHHQQQRPRDQSANSTSSPAVVAPFPNLQTQTPIQDAGSHGGAVDAAPPQHSGIATSPHSVRRRRRAPSVMDSGPDVFQDVYDSRRPDATANLARLQSIRTTAVSPPTSAGHGGGGSSSGIGAPMPGIERSATRGSLHSIPHQRRFWGGRGETIREGGDDDRGYSPIGGRVDAGSGAERMV